MFRSKRVQDFLHRAEWERWVMHFLRYGERKLAQGRDAVKELLTKDNELCAEIEEKVRTAMKEAKNKE